MDVRDPYPGEGFRGSQPIANWVFRTMLISTQRIDQALQSSRVQLLVDWIKALRAAGQSPTRGSSAGLRPAPERAVIEEAPVTVDVARTCEARHG
jgi:hypothetical protein